MPQKSIMDLNAGILPLTKGPTDSGGVGPFINGKKNGNLETGNKDEEGHGIIESLIVAAPQPAPKSNSTLQAKLTQSSHHKDKEQNMNLAMASLKNMIKQQYKTINALLAATDQLTLAREKTKSPLVENAIEQVIGSVEALKTSTSSVHGAFYEAEKAAIRGSTSDQGVASLANQEAILKICDELKA